MPPRVPASGWASVVTDHGDLAGLAEMLRWTGVQAVVPGDEAAVPAAESLASQLGLPGNDPATSSWRTDKAGMQQALQDAGVSHPFTARACSAEGAAAAARVAGLPGRPVVIKPSWRSGSEDVTVCRLPQDVPGAWHRAAAVADMTGRTGGAPVVQEYLAGQQWTVNTVTVTGSSGRTVHVLTDMWRERVSITDGGHVAWGESWLVPPQAPGEDGKEVAEYAFDVLAAVGVVTGPAHLEIILTGDGPRLVEIAARLAGCYPPDLTAEVAGQSHLSATAAAIADPGAFTQRVPPAPDGMAVAQAWLAAPADAWLDGAVLAQALSLPALRSFTPRLAAGGQVTMTRDTGTSPGWLNFCGPAAAVEADIRRLREELEPRLYRTVT
jgi:biotin carboxylase